MQQKTRNTFLALTGIFCLSCMFVFSARVNSLSSADKRFQVAMKTVLRHEGGLSNDKNDPGGITKYGISLRYIKSEHIDPNHDGVEDKNDIIYLTLTDADNIYYKEFYKKNHYDKINNQLIITKVLDFAINAGPSQANKLTKRAINRITPDAITVNGIMDYATIEIINLIEPAVLYSALVAEEEEFYKAIVKHNPQLKVFLKGWIARCND